MSHSKRNTSLAFFTSHERSLLKSTWGSQATRLSRESFLPFASCQLCLQIARDPVACASNGDIFCRECAVNNLLAQRKEIKRLEKEDVKRRKEMEEEERERGQEEKERAVLEFERVMMGMEGSDKKSKRELATDSLMEGDSQEPRGSKRKFQLDEDEVLRNAKAERARAREALDEEKSSKPVLPSFWVPSLTPSSNHISTDRPTKLSPLCPASSPGDSHPLALKTLVSIKFTTTQSNPPLEDLTLICPACKKGLTNTLKAMLAVPCGHVLCKPCAGKFMSGAKGSKAPVDAHAPAGEHHLTCYVCDTDLCGTHNEKDGEKSGLRAGVVEIKSEGTGFAGAGTNMAKRQGVAFQC